MPSFRYEVRAPGGQTNSGVMNAVSIEAASDLLRSKDLYILQLVPATGGSSFAEFQERMAIALSPKPGLKEVTNFTQQLAVMVKAGISIRAALEGIGDQTPNKRFQQMILQMRKDIESGKSFSDALNRYPETFSSLYLNMVKASEMSGTFAEMLERIVEYLTVQLETRQMVVGAMIYPGVIGFLATSVTIFLLVVIVPRFMGIFEGKEHLLPLPTKILMALSKSLQDYWYIYIGTVLALVVGIKVVLASPQGQLAFDQLKLNVPVMKKMFRALYISRSLHTMGELVNAGVPMLDTLRITGEVSGNSIYHNMWNAVGNSVKSGKKIAQTLQRNPMLPPAVIQLISAGEESGRLGEVLDSISKYYNKELKSTIKAVTSLIEPIMIVLMGGIVAFIAMSIMLPIFRMSQLVKD